MIAGPSGSGKSTLLRCINGLETIDEGDIRFDGRSVPAAGKDLFRLRAEIGMVFQSFNLFAHKSVLAQHHARPDQGEGHVRARREPAWRATSWSGSASRRKPTTSRPTSRAASSSGSRSPVRSRWSRS